MLVVLGSVVLVGGGRRLLQAWKARKAVARLSQPDVTPQEIESVAPFGRSGLHELFRIFSEPSSTTLRDAAGQAISVLWAHDQLIAEEEQALVRRGYTVQWVARRRYPGASGATSPSRQRMACPVCGLMVRGSNPPIWNGRTGSPAPPRGARGILGLDGRSGPP